MSRDQNAGHIHNIQTNNSSFKMAEQFKYFGTNLPYQNSVQEEINVDRIQGMLAIIRCRIFCLPVCCPKI